MGARRCRHPTRAQRRILRRATEQWRTLHQAAQRKIHHPAECHRTRTEKPRTSERVEELGVIGQIGPTDETPGLPTRPTSPPSPRSLSPQPKELVEHEFPPGLADDPHIYEILNEPNLTPLLTPPGSATQRDEPHQLSDDNLSMTDVAPLATAGSTKRMHDTGPDDDRGEKRLLALALH